MAANKKNSIFATMIAMFFLNNEVSAMSERVQSKAPSAAVELTIATFNVSMEAENYVLDPSTHTKLSPQVLQSLLMQGKHPQIKNIAAIIQAVQPDILLLNEFDYIADPEQGIRLFIRNFLQKSQQGGQPLNYPYVYINTVNTGQPSGFDLNRDGTKSNTEDDAWGYGKYPGQYAMALLSKYPLDEKHIRTFQHFKWKDMPNARQPRMPDQSLWYADDAWQQMPLSSKSHWHIPVTIHGHRLHLLASHPTPPVFDGIEKRNFHRNHDEIRFWVDYLTPNNAGYIYDDKQQKGGFDSVASAESAFVVMGDQNASAVEGSADKAAISALLAHPRVQNQPEPSSKGGQLHSPNNPHAAAHTAGWRMRADYVLPSKAGIKVLDSGVFWPAPTDALHSLVASREASSDHRLVWIKIRLETSINHLSQHNQ
jgi:hypothetical protein